MGFTINKNAVTAEQMVVLQAGANYMSANPNVKMKVVGYADRQSGKASYNLKISEKRAKAVYDLLVKKFRVPAERLTYIGLGDQEQPFKEDVYNRSVIILGER